jgi:hypothetical protein
MRCLFQTIGAASIFSLTLLLAAGEAQPERMRSLSDFTVCGTALNSARSGWDHKNLHKSDIVTEATRRGLSITHCRQKLSCSGILARPAMQKLAATALTQTMQEVNSSPNAKWDAGRVFDSFQPNLLRLINLKIPPPSYGSRGPPQIVDYGGAAMLQATREMTADQFTACFPQAWEFAFNIQWAQKELELRQEKAREEARIEAAKPINRLRQAYFNYMVVKRCYDVRLGYQLVYINEVELERARRAVNAIETSALKEDSSINTSATWQEGVQMLGASKEYVEQYFCQKTYNDLLNAAPYSPPAKDFGVQRY